MSRKLSCTGQSSPLKRVKGLVRFVALIPCLFMGSAWANESACETSTIDAIPNLVVPIYIDKQHVVGNHPQLTRDYVSYEVSLGANNEYDNFCMTQDEATLLYTLEDSRFEFVDMQYYENGLPSTQMVQIDIHKQYVRVVYQRSNDNSLKYTITLREKRTGAVIVLDPSLSTSSDGANPP
ncbi:hypothetical protein [uncultured Umboniibacter sp.]|uniref:hypothetical protein n=1 Tax=uncultured Umboniibacter sp. TaxID=1798917 RepID=UPI00260CA9BA|nr:hypothetical protein [uncultured Umboniibacter sp.]